MTGIKRSFLDQHVEIDSSIPGAVTMKLRWQTALTAAAIYRWATFILQRWIYNAVST
jgi:hypothetical protein